MELSTNAIKRFGKERSLKLALLILTFTLSAVLLIWGPSLIGGISAMTILVIISWYLTKMELMHPLTWFPPIFLMYSISMPILVLSGERAYVPALDYTLIVQWIALATFIFFMGIPKEQEKKFDISVMSNLRIVSTPIYIIALGLSAFYLWYIYSSGLSSKYAISLDQSVFSNLQPFFSIFVISFLLLFTYKLIKKNKIPKLFTLFSMSFALIVLMIAGERDILLRVLLGVIILVHFLYKPIKRRYLIILGSIGVLSIPFLGNLKNFAFGSRTLESDSSFIAEIFGGEFMSASRNLNTLITHPESWSHFYGETFFWDIQVATFGNAISPGAWFNQTFYSNLVSRGGGNGFTVVGEGYMNFGILGVILVFAIIAIFLRFLYKKAHLGLIWLIIYTGMIPIMVYVIRGDMATLLTQFSKHIVLPLLLVYIAKLILEKKPLVIKKRYKGQLSNS